MTGGSHPDAHPDYEAMDREIRRWRNRTRDHANCARMLKEVLLAGGSEATVKTVRPLVNGPYTLPPHICLHGTRFWVEPTGEQIARWAADGIL